MLRYDMSDTIDGINNNTYELLFGGKEEIDNYAMMNDIPDSYMLMLYTLIKNKFDLNNKASFESVKPLYEEITSSKMSIKPNTGKFLLKHKYTSDNFNFYFNKLTDVLECDEEEYEELHSFDRYGNCHMESISNCMAIKGSFLVTGVIEAGGVSIIHSVTNYLLGNKEMCIDYTRNLVMPYEEYKKMHNFKEINRIDHEKVIEDFKEDNSLISKTGISLKTYCIFRDEIFNQINKSLGEKGKTRSLEK